MDAAVNEIVAVFPRLGHAAGIGVMLQNPRAIAVHPRVAARRQPGDAGSDDDDGFFGHARLMISGLNPSSTRLLNRRDENGGSSGRASAHYSLRRKKSWSRRTSAATVRWPSTKTWPKAVWGGRTGQRAVELFQMNAETKRNKQCQTPPSAKVWNRFPYLEPALQQEFMAWASHHELSKLFGKLKSQQGELWLDHYVEAMFARHLMQEGCALEVEVPTQKGKSADFKVTKSNECFFVHVKHLTMDKVTSEYRDWCYKQFEQLQELKTIRKPLAVQVSLKVALTKRQAAEFVEVARPFLKKTTKEGEEFSVRDKSGNLLGKCEVLFYPINSDHVELCPDSPDEPVVRDSKRFINGLKEAYKQFMPGATNIILFTGDWTKRTEFEAALSGEFTLIRDSETKQFVRTRTRHNGFWSGGKHSNSNLAVWFEIDENDEVGSKLYIRDGFQPKQNCMVSLFDKPASLKPASLQS
jgi:hypothetical protein